MHWLYSSGRRYTYVDQLQSCRPEILYPQLVHGTPNNRNPEKYTAGRYAGQTSELVTVVHARDATVKLC